MSCVVMRSQVIRHGTTVIGDQYVAGLLKPKQDVRISDTDRRRKGLPHDQDLYLRIKSQQLALNRV